MSWSKTDASNNIKLYADTQHTEGGMEEGHSVRSRYTAVVMMVAWRGDRGAVAWSSIAVHVVTVIVAVIQVRMTLVGIRVTPGMAVVVVMGRECK